MVDWLNQNWPGYDYLFLDEGGGGRGAYAMVGISILRFLLRRNHQAARPGHSFRLVAWLSDAIANQDRILGLVVFETCQAGRRLPTMPQPAAERERNALFFLWFKHTEHLSGLWYKRLLHVNYRDT